MEWNAASLTHKAYEAIGDELVSKLEFYNIEHSPAVMNQALLAISRLPVSETGFEKLVLGFYKLEEPEMFNDDILDQFAQHCKSLKELRVHRVKQTDEDAEKDRLSVVQLVTSILE